MCVIMASGYLGQSNVARLKRVREGIRAHFDTTTRNALPFHVPTHPRPLPGGEQASVRAAKVPLLGGVRGGFMVPMHAPKRMEAPHEPPLTRPSATLSPAREGRRQGEGWTTFGGAMRAQSSEYSLPARSEWGEGHSLKLASSPRPSAFEGGEGEDLLRQRSGWIKIRPANL